MMRCIFLALSVVGVASSDAVGKKNLAAAQRDLELGEGKQWNTATPEEAQKLMDEEAALINCAFTPSSTIGFAATGKSQTECGEMFGKSFTGISTHKGWKCDWAVAEGSGGKTVIAWCPFKYTLDSTGEVRVIRVTGNELLLLLTVLCHEMGHGTMARRCGGTIAQVLLWPFGGICFTTRPQGRGAREKLVDDLWIVGAGPATHFPMSAAWFALLASYVAMCSHVIFPPSWKYLVPFGSAMPPCMAAGYTGRRAKDSGV
eukprot:s589_g6.t2